jgi:hypothetical protein
MFGVATGGLTVGPGASLPGAFRVTGSKLFGTTCGQRSMAIREPVTADATPAK